MGSCAIPPELETGELVTGDGKFGTGSNKIGASGEAGCREQCIWFPSELEASVLPGGNDGTPCVVRPRPWIRSWSSKGAATADETTRLTEHSHPFATTVAENMPSKLLMQKILTL